MHDQINCKKSPTGSLPAVSLAITPTFRPWTHTSDDSYMYQLSLVVATATVSFLAPYARTTRYEEPFLPEGLKGPRSLRSLGLASLLIVFVRSVAAININSTTHDIYDVPTW